MGILEGNGAAFSTNEKAIGAQDFGKRLENTQDFGKKLENSPLESLAQLNEVKSNHCALRFAIIEWRSPFWGGHLQF